MSADQNLLFENNHINDEQREMIGKLFVKEGQSNGDEEVPPEEAIPDLPENASARGDLKYFIYSSQSLFLYLYLRINRISQKSSVAWIIYACRKRS